MPGFPWLPLVLCVGLRPQRLFSVQVSVFFDVIWFMSQLGGYVGETSDIARKHNLTEVPNPLPVSLIPLPRYSLSLIHLTTLDAGLH